ncbi:SDR family NAD(P)-dependent oxidoreductase [Actinomadura graeca]|uniref:SDR family NAD(P)-dependent oxidoreductase n=2 Tax=Actinomadura graeca TaxID=2750812 RepID=A0ABX8RDE7_9ACTN|nr:SDR family NAD(P)-dependent oxidoreductase [Actinomadura graeca]
MASEEKLVDYLKRVASDLHDTRLRLRELEDRRAEPVAVVGMACRLPGGVGSPEELWDLVASGRDAIGGFPADRGWELERLFHPDPDHPGTSYVREGGFVDGADRFDAGFFGISPREALASNPQQRMLLEVAWELLERAGIVPDALRGTPTGVYIGTATTGSSTHSDPSGRATDGYAGNAPSVLSGRVSYTLGLEGPAVTVETACSSSLVAMHLACQALRDGDCTLALAGGVTVMVTPEAFTAFSRQRGLALDGRCKPFSAAADGTSWGEGAGLVLLERLSDAQRLGHRVLGVIRSSAVNQDGASNGMTAPNGPSQERVIRQALAAARLPASAVDAVEAHGTGTTLGDPIEAGALLATYGRDRPADRPLLLGSVKSNIGHTQGAAGVAGVIKTIMAMRHGRFPATLHLGEPTPHVDWSSGAIRLPAETTGWPRAGRPRRAGVSSFGISGTNAHLILEEAPEQPAETTSEAPVPGPVPAGAPVPWVVSARNPAALREQARRLGAFAAAEDGRPPAAVGRALAATRSVFEHRAVVLGHDRAALLAGLDAVADGAAHPDVVTGEATGTGPGPVLVFPGQGSQWAGMGAALLEASPAFAARIAECEEALAPHVDWSLTGVLRGDDDAAGLRRVDVVQPALWAMMVSLAAVWDAHGVRPAAVVGHSQGEIAAACVAGALSLADGARIVAVRARALRGLSGRGAMASLALGEDDTSEIISGLGGAADGVVVAAVNGPSSTVVSGPPDRVAAVLAAAGERGARTRTIDVDYASHGPQIDEIADGLTAALGGATGVGPASAEVAFYSSLTGARADTAALDGEYWVTNLRRPVRFAAAVKALLDDGYRLFIEASPHPVLTVGVQECADEAGSAAAVLPTLRRDQGGPERLARSLGEAFAAGAAVDWTAWFPADLAPRPLDLPTYPFQRERYWLSAGPGTGDVAGLGLSPADHPLLGAALETADGDGRLLTGRLPGPSGSWLGDHAIAGTPVVAGSVLVDWALRAADGSGCATVEELTLRAPLVLPENGAVRVQVAVGAAADDGRRDVQIYSRPDDDSVRTWECHATGVLAPEPETPEEDLRGQWPPAGAEPVDVAGFYERAASEGYEYGPAFQGLRAAWRRGTDLFAEVGLPKAAGEADGYGLHPALLDAALHPAILDGGLGGGPGDDEVWLPFAWNGVALHAVGATAVRVRLTRDGEGLRILITDPAGEPVLGVDTLRMRPADAARLGALATRDASGLLTLDWTPLPQGPVPDGEDWAVLGPDGLDALPADAPAPAIVLADPVRADDTGTAEEALAATEQALDLVRGFLADTRLADSLLAVVTRGGAAGAAVGGLVRSAQAEHPGRFVLVDLGAATTDGDPAATPDGPERPDRSEAEEAVGAARIAVAADEPHVAVRGGRTLVPRLTRPSDAGDAAPPPLDEDDTVAVVGGTGMLGGLVAEHLVRAYGARRLLLLSRRGEQAPGAGDLRGRLAGLGAHADVAAVDVADEAALAEALARIPADRPLAGVVHAGGVIDDAVLTSQTAERLRHVWAPKALGAWNLHVLTRDLPLKFFLVFSSAAGVVGNAGQAGYAAANAFCDALVAHRRGLGLPGTSVAWGLWADASAMTGHVSGADLARVRGMRPLSADRGLSLLDAAWRLGAPCVVAADLDLAGLPSADVPAILRGPAGRTRRRAATGADATALAARLAGLDAPARSALVAETVRERVAAVLGFRSPGDVGMDASFKDLGVDSLTAVEVRNRLTSATGLRLPTTLVFDYPTPRALAEYVAARVTGESTAVDLAPAAASAVRADEPVAIVGMACRYPGGVRGPEDLWDLVASGRDAVGDFPSDRGWDFEGLFHPDRSRPGTSHTRAGAFLYDAGEFDSAFFGVSPREALAADPQQRLVLETAWEVLERAGIDPLSLKGTRTGVYTGVMYHDYAAGAAEDDARMEGYVMPGAGSVVPGRVAYTLGLEGPAVTVDTACSSSLVAVHLASQALRQGECDLALAGGVTVMATPGLFTGFSRQQGLAPDGRCKSFAASADGTGWGEGVGLLALERLSDARRRGHRVLAVVRGSAVNQDGASNGLTAPNGPSQQRVIGQALAGAGLSASDVDAVEAHGTGTRLGDPIEAQALLAAYGRGRAEDRPLWLGSVKSNIGHTQAAAGVAGVIKMVMAMRHGTLPASLHIDEPTPHVDWDAGAVRLLTEPVPWPETGRSRRAGVSSFGASGTNAHLIIEQGPEDEHTAGETERPGGGVVPWVVSARSEAALREQVARLGGVAGDPVEVGWSLVSSRSSFEWRSVAVGESREELLAGLQTGVVATRPQGECVWLFSGQGAQRVGMGAGLYERFPVFAETFDEVCGLLDPELKEVVFSGPAEELEHTTFAQMGLFAVQVALARLLGSMGVRPDVVVGHSVGEVAAAHVAGVLDLGDACRLVSARARLMGGLPAGGAMAAIQADPGELAGELPEGVGVAAVNTPGSAVVSGPADLVARVQAVWAERGRKTKGLPVSHGFHSVLMEPMLAGFGEAIGGLGFGVPVVPLVSTLTGELVGEEIAAAQYWVRQVREPVRFLPAIVSLGERAGVFIELGPDPVLATAAQQILDERRVPSVAALHCDRPDTRALGAALGALHVHGIDVDWTGWFPDKPRPRTIDLPTYAFQRERYWLTSRQTARDAGLTSMELADGDVHVLTGRLSADGGWLADHQVQGTVLVPGTALLGWALRVADDTGAAGVEELALQSPLVLPSTGALRIQVVAGAAGEDGRRDVQVYSRPDGEVSDGWVRHAEGVLLPPQAEPAEPVDTLAGQWPPAGAEPMELDGFYERAAEAGYEYGPSFRGLRAAWRLGGDLLAEVELPGTVGDQDGFGVHPALLDAAMHPALLAGEADGRTWLPFVWSGVSLWAAGARTVRVRLTPASSVDEQSLRLHVADTAGAPVLTVEHVGMRAADGAELRAAAAQGTRGLYTLDWTAVSDAEAAGEPRTGGWPRLGRDPYPGLAAFVSALESGADVPPVVLADVAAADEALALVREWLDEPRTSGIVLAVVTKGAVAGGTDENAAAVWGLVRSVQSEHPGRFVLADADGGSDVAAAVWRALRLDEPQVAVRDDRLLVPRLVPAGAAAELVGPAGRHAWRLVAGRSGTLEGVTAEAFPEALEPLGPGQVRVEVRAAGINFRDALVALGMVTAPGGLGGEGAGVVTEVGPEVSGLSVGDRVMGLFPGAFGAVAVADARMVAAIPDGWGFQEAAAVPVAFLTAWYGLVDLARLRAGESVLVHAATGGVGMAAVQIARHVGAHVYGTASPGKHGVLEEMGVDAGHRASSRDLDFEEVIRSATGGEGVDVVLNALAGPFTDASLRLLRDGGRFLEMGKTDIHDPEEVAAAHPGVEYRVFDLISDAGPDRIGEMLGILGELFAGGVLRPPPVRTWPLERARDALRYMSQARHTGKLVLDVPARLDPDGTVLITGGTGGLGALTAEHLAREWGVRHLVLVSRRGADAPGAAELAGRLEALGAAVSIAAADVADPAAVDALIAGIDPAHPLTGVVHAAGVVDDATIGAQTPERLERVWAAKAAAMANLHAATARLRLGMFVVYSSAAAVLGSPGQANYAAANAYCDALAARRRAAGLAGLSVGWGPWESASGMMAGLSDTDRARMSRGGFEPLSSRRGLELLDAACGHGAPYLVAVELDAVGMAGRPAEALPPVLRGLAASGTRGRPAAAGGHRPVDWAGRLAGLAPGDQLDVLLGLVRDHAASVLGHADPAAVQVDTPFKDLGFDSLTGVELRNRLAAATGLRLPAALVFRHPSPAAIAGHLRERLAPAGQDPSAPVLGELDRLETVIARYGPDGETRVRLTKRLEALLWRLNGEDAGNGGGGTAAVDGAALDAASDDEMFELIDRELGTS